jgi:E3 ubiquitin-protein ligase RAD18
LTADGKCPTCREGDQAVKLRNNLVVQELVSAFQAARPSILKFGQEALAARSNGVPESRKRKVEVLSSQESDKLELSPRKTRAQRRRVSAEPARASVEQAGVEETEEQEVPIENEVSETLGEAI